MKRILALIVLFVLASAMCVGAQSDVRVIIPEYEVRVGDSSIYYYDSLYPLISYKDVTYFPMTFEYCQALDIAISWSQEKGLFIVYQPNGSSHKLPVYDTASNYGKLTAVIPEYPIYINGKLISNSNSEYPVLNFRGVTYFPMTWDYAHEEFAWETNWEDGLFTLNRGLRAESKMYFEAAFNDGFVVSDVIDRDVEREDGTHTIETEIEYYKFFYETEELTKLDDYDYKDHMFQYTEANTEIVDGVCCFGEQQLPEISILTESYDDGMPEYTNFIDHTTGKVVTNKDKILKAENNVSGRGYTLGGIQFYDFTNNYILHRENTTSYGRPTYTYVEQNGKLIYIGTDTFVSEAALGADGNVYFNTLQQVKTIRTRTSIKNELWRLTPDGTIESVNKEFPDYNSMEIIGSVDGTIYLRNTWFPEWFSEYGYTVSAINDGYYSYKGVGTDLVKEANYVYANESFVSSDGKLFALIQWKNEIKKLN